MARLGSVLCLVVSLLACGGGEPGASPAPREETPREEATPAALAPPAPAMVSASTPAPRRERAPTADAAKTRAFRRALREARRAHRAGAPNTIELYRAALALDNNGPALCELGFVELTAGRTADARRSLERALALLPTDPPVPPAFVGSVGACLYNLGRLEEATGDLDRARAYYARSLAVRPDNRTVAARLAALPSAPVAVSGANTCQRGESKALDLQAWATRVRALSGGPSAFTEALAELGLSPVEEEQLTDTYGDPLEAPVLRAEVDVCDLAQPNATVKLVHVRIALEDNHLDRVSVVRVGPAGICVLGTIEQSQDACSTNCGSDDPPFVVSLVRLVARDVDAIRVDTSGGACACGSERGGESETTFYGVSADALVTYLGIERYSGWYVSPVPPMSERMATFSLSTELPARIRVERRVVCTEGCTTREQAARRREIERERDPDTRQALEEALESDCGYYPEECEPSRRVVEYSFLDGTYRESPGRP